MDDFKVFYDEEEDICRPQILAAKKKIPNADTSALEGQIEL
ncbi:MAG: hypothetical protein WC649_02385 [Desulfobacteria bacterium]